MFREFCISGVLDGLMFAPPGVAGYTFRALPVVGPNRSV
jgi:hypothetical protein